MSTPTRKILATIVASIVLFAGCGGDDEAALVIVDVNGAIQEYRTAQDDLVLPAGAAWPENTPVLTPSAEAGMFEYGVGIQEAQSVWYCAWAREAITGDTTQQAASVESLKEFPEQFGADGKFSKGDDSLRQYYTAMMEAADLGDVSPLQEHVVRECPNL